MNERHIKISLTPHSWDNADKPYFWVVMEWNEQTKGWSNSGICGWAKTPIDAFNEGYQSNLKDIEKDKS